MGELVGHFSDERGLMRVSNSAQIRKRVRGTMLNPKAALSSFPKNTGGFYVDSG